MSNLLSILKDKSNRLKFIYRFRGKIFAVYKGRAVPVSELKRRIEQRNNPCTNTVNILYKTHRVTSRNKAIPDQIYASWLFMEYCRVKLWVRK